MKTQTYRVLLHVYNDGKPTSRYAGKPYQLEYECEAQNAKEAHKYALDAYPISKVIRSWIFEV